MHMKGLGLGGLLAVVALVGCGSSGNSTGTGGNTGTGATGHAGSTGTAGNGSAGHSGGGTTGTGAGFTTSVPSGVKLTGLTSSQQTQLCSDIAKYATAEAPAICNASASFDGLIAAYFDLLENPSATNAELQADCTTASLDAGTCGPTGTCDIASIPSTCQATVGDYTTCINQLFPAEIQYLDSFPSCSSITAASLNALFAADGGASSNPTESATCMMFDSTCSTNDAGTAALTSMSPLPTLRRKR